MVQPGFEKNDYRELKSKPVLPLGILSHRYDQFGNQSNDSEFTSAPYKLKKRTFKFIFGEPCLPK